MSREYYIEVILPLAVRSTFSYLVPEHLLEELIVGKRVVVPFGARRYYAGLIYKLDVQPPKGIKQKKISYVMDDEPVITEMQLVFWEWMARYYMSGLGSIMHVALPNALKISSQTTVALYDGLDEMPELTEDERMLYNQMNDGKDHEVTELEKLSTRTAIQRALDGLIRKGVVVLTEELKNIAKPRTIEFVRLTEEYEDQTILSEFLNSLSNAPKQMELLMRFVEMSGYFQGEATLVQKKQLLEKAKSSTAILNSLMKKGVFELKIEVEGWDSQAEEAPDIELNELQQQSFQEIKSSFESKDVCLMRGVTGSGKTLIYAELAKEYIEHGKQVLYLVPEIALTTQLVQRLKKLLGMEVMIYHSRFSNKDRLTTWLNLLNSREPVVVVGARSSVFLPFQNLGLVIVDEEHESSYKQHESSPFYHARDAVIWLAKKMQAKVLLGSATPSIEFYHHAKKGRFGLTEINKRFGDVKMPEIQVVDVKAYTKNQQMVGGLSPELKGLVHATLKQGKQVILFQNRRGYAPYQMCETCGWSAGCVNCDVNLTYHKYFKTLLCHYCGYNMKQPAHCPECGSAKLTVKGVGTEKIEDDLEIIFPEARMGRMDLDTTRKKNALQNLISAFEEGSIDILVGTQMVTKGLDFENVGLVGVINADSLWSRPDFRAFERAYQLLTQVAGRSGRKKDRGKVMIQTYKPEHPVLEYVISQDYRGMYNNQVMERQYLSYPPFSRMIRFQLAHPDATLTREAAKFFADELRKEFDTRVLGPEEPPIARIRGKFLRQVFLKLETQRTIGDSRKLLWQVIDHLEGHETYRKVKLSVDVDPS